MEVGGRWTDPAQTRLSLWRSPPACLPGILSAGGSLARRCWERGALQEEAQLEARPQGSQMKTLTTPRSLLPRFTLGDPGPKKERNPPKVTLQSCLPAGLWAPRPSPPTVCVSVPPGAPPHPGHPGGSVVEEEVVSALSLPPSRALGRDARLRSGRRSSCLGHRPRRPRLEDRTDHRPGAVGGPREVEAPQWQVGDAGVRVAGGGWGREPRGAGPEYSGAWFGRCRFSQWEGGSGRASRVPRAPRSCWREGKGP